MPSVRHQEKADIGPVAAPVAPQDNASFAGQFGGAGDQPAPVNPSGFGSFLGGLWSGISNMFKPQSYGAVRSPRAGPYYQVKPSDQSMAQVATNIGVPLQNLVEANNGVRSLPPSGSFIQTKLGAYNAGNVAGRTPAQAPAPFNVGAITAAREGGKYQPPALTPEVTNEISRINISRDLGQPVNSVGYNAAAILGFTPSDMMIAGYAPDLNTRTWVYSPAPSGGGDEGGKPYRNRKGSMIRNASQRGKLSESYYSPAPIPTPQDNASQAVQTVLGLRLGSG